MNLLRVVLILIAKLCALNAFTMDKKVLNNAKFATDLYNVLAAESPRENFIFSPFSIQTCAAMLYTGAAGTTAEDMAKGLQLPVNNRNEIANKFQTTLTNHEKEQLEIANKIYVATGLRVEPEFHKILTEKFNSAEEVVNFMDKEKTKATINDWVKNKTHHKITDIIKDDSFSNDTLLMLLNAIYFKGIWEYIFPPSFKGNFWTIDGENKEIDFMSQTEEFKTGDLPELDAQVLEMDYRLSNISMMIILPKNKNGLNMLEEKLSSVDLLEISAQLEVQDYFQLILPKFRIEYSVDLKQPFEKLGMSQIFSDNADFSNMIPGKVKVGKALHKTLIDVNEHGTEVLGFTGFRMDRIRSYPTFHATHPFVFVIKSKTDILFLGRFVK